MGWKNPEDHKTYDSAYRLAHSKEIADYHKVWYQNNKKRLSASTLARRNVLRQLIIDAKNVPCADCGRSYPPYVMDFDHVIGEKEFNIGMAPALNKPLKKVIEEIAKCDVVCSNCHRERTYG